VALEQARGPEEGTATTATISRALRAEPPSDEDLVRRIRAGDTALFEVLMRRYNQRLYRVARGIVRDHAEAEDVMQQAYLNAYAHLHQYEHRGSFAGWLTRIAVREAFARHRRRAEAAITESIVGDAPCDRIPSRSLDPEQAALASEGWRPDDLFRFGFARCDRVVAAVLARLGGPLKASTG